MAGDWIKIEHVTPEKPEVFRIADALDIDPDAAFGKLTRIWIWADQQTTSGNAVGVSKSLVDRKAGVNGFADAMIMAGWLTEDSDGFTFTNFGNHNGKTAKQRALTARRVSKHANAASVSLALPREEKRRDKEKVNKKKKDSPVYSDEFNEFWDSCPRKVGKGHAWKAWPKALKIAANSPHKSPDESVAEFLTRRMLDYASFVADKDAQFVRHPATWLNGGNWDDEIGSRVPTEDDWKNWKG